MTARPTWFWTSLFTSIGVNAVLLVSSACWLGSGIPIASPAPEKTASADPIFIVTPPQPPRDSILGELAGKGDAADASTGEIPMEARQGSQVQAFLSRDPEGPGQTRDEPSKSTQIPGENGSGADRAPAPFGVASNEQAQAEPTPKFDPPPHPTETTANQNAAQPNHLEPPGDQPAAPKTDPSVAVASVSEATPLLEQTQPRTQSPSGGKPGPPVAPADPAPQSDTESDAFSKKGSVTFKRGSTDVQFGRKHKIVDPRLGLGAQADLLQIPQPVTLTLALSLDENGNVIAVDILKSSGSRNVDQACKVAAYKWWLEPTKDKNGKPIKDVVPFSVGFP